MMLVSLTGYGRGALGGQRRKTGLLYQEAGHGVCLKNVARGELPTVRWYDSPGWCHGVEDDFN